MGEFFSEKLFGRIFLENFFGGFFWRNSLFTELEFVKILVFVKILSQWRRKEEGRKKFKSLERTRNSELRKKLNKLSKALKSREK